MEINNVLFPSVGIDINVKYQLSYVKVRNIQEGKSNGQIPTQELRESEKYLGSVLKVMVKCQFKNYVKVIIV